MQYPFVVNPSIVREEIIDTIYRKLEQAQALADSSAIFAVNQGSDPIISGSFGLLSDLMDDLKQLFEVLVKKMELTAA